MHRIRSLHQTDARSLAAAFYEIGWDKPASLFLRYLQEEQDAERVSWVATVDGEEAGYITVQWKSNDQAFAREGVPEIKDLNVLPRFRRRGIGCDLLRTAEKAIGERSTVAGLRVGLHSGYGEAQKLYGRRGYLPDGAGAVDEMGRPIPEGSSVELNDLITLRLVRRLEEHPPSDGKDVTEWAPESG